MELTTAQEVLVTLLSVALTVLLVLAIVVLVLVIKLLQAIRLITTKAEKLVESAEAVGQVFKNVSGPMAVFKVIKSVVDMVQRKEKNKEN